ncbi:MAG: hypothetical protein RJB66_2085 [Pseudomonadota bacterium]|jgi:hypothetical protein
MKLVFWLCFTILTSRLALGQEVTDAQSLREKIKSFDEFELIQERYEDQRDNGLNQLLDDRKKAKQQREKELEEFLKQKASQKRVKPEDTPAYDEYLLQKWEWRMSQEKAATVERLQKKNFARDKKALAFEIREYGLENSEANRVPYNKRKLLGSKASSTGGGFGGGYGGGAIPPYIPPPVEEIPDFGDDIPPPPPPPPMPEGGGFDDIDPGFQPPPPPPPPMD